MSPLLTFIVPTYNMGSLCQDSSNSSYLERCLNSLIINNTFLLDRIEVLIINDGSKDNSLSIAKSFAAKYPNTFKIIDKQNGNYGSCINVGLVLASGKYVKILDADDFVDSESLQDYLVYLDKVDVDLIFTNICFYNELTGSKSFTRCTKEDKVYSFRDFLEDRSHSPFVHSLTYNRNVFEGLNYHQTEGISYTDSEWTALPMTHVQTCRYYDRTLYYYVSGREGQTMNATVMSKSVDQWLTVTMSLCKMYAEYNGDEWHKQYLKECFIQSVSMLYCNPGFKVVRKHFIIQFEEQLAELYPFIYQELSTYRMDRTTFLFIQCHRHPWLYMLKTFLKKNNFWWQFDKANFYGMLKPIFVVNIIYKIHSLFLHS